MELFWKIQFYVFVIGAVLLIAFSFYVDAIDKRGSVKKGLYLRILKILIVVYSLWFIFSGFYFNFFTDYFTVL